MKLVTVATHSNGYFSVFMQSCKRFGIQPVILGYGQKWQGFTWRWKLLENYLATLPEDEIVIFTDAYDVLLLKPIDEIEKRYRELCPKLDKVLVSIEDVKATKSSIMNYMLVDIFGLCRGQRINAGTFIAPKKIFIQMIENICSFSNCNDRYNDDQKIMTSFCDKSPHLFIFDQHRYIFFVCNNMPDTACKLYKKYDSCVLHAAGNINIDAIAKELNYDISQVNNRGSYFLGRTMHYFHQYKMQIVIIASVILIIYILRKVNRH